jgi:hypothetical protein
MKSLMFLFIAVISIPTFAQFKDSGEPLPDIKDGIVNHSNYSSLFGFINPDNFQMKQSVGMSYLSSGGQGMAIGTYTNNMSYKFNENLNVELEASVINTPYSTLGNQFNKSMSGIYISNAAINYQPWKDFSISVRYSNLPYSFYSPYSSFGGYRYGFFNGF